MSLFFLQILMMLSLGAIVFLAATALPRISDTEIAQETGKDKTNWWSALPFEKIDTVFNSFLEKTLRRIKLILMKLDNALTHSLGKFKKNNSHNNSGNPGNGLSQ